jgi:hypothetical protein
MVLSSSRLTVAAVAVGFLFVQGQVTFSFEVSTAVTLHEPVIFSVSVTNDSDRDLVVDLGLDRIERFQFELHSPTGSIRTIRPRPREGASLVPRFVLRPSSSASDRRPGPEGDRFVGAYLGQAVLDEWLDFSTVGEYVLHVKCDGVIQPGSGVSTESITREGTFHIVVKPSDPERLRAKAQMLVQVSAAYDTRHDFAIRQLMYMPDPAVIPELTTAIITTRRTDLMATLVRIGGPDAKAALESLSHSPVDFVASAAKEALTRIR